MVDPQRTSREVVVDDLALVRLFSQVAKRLRSAASARLAPHGVVLGQNLLLEQLWADDGLTPGEIAARLGISGPTAVRMAQRMEDSGFVTRRRDDRDGRLVRVYLTDRGRALQAPVQVAFDELHARALDGFDGADRDALGALLQRMLVNIDGELGGDDPDVD